MDLGQLNQLLENQSYIGNEVSATLEDYAKAREIKSVDAKYPHVARWHAHVLYLAARFPTHDWRGQPIAKGSGGGGAAPSQAKKEDNKPKQENKKEAKGKASPKAAPAAAPAGGAPDQAAIDKVSEDIRQLKEKLKSEGKKGKEVNDNPQVKSMVEKLQKLKKGEKVQEEPAAKDTSAEDRKKQLKKVIKEGGKRGVEIEGAADMGGLQYFCTSMDEVQGDLDFIEESMKAMNAESDPTEEERKGGSGKIGKMLFSAGDAQLALAAYVPKDLQKENDATTWLQHVLNMFGGVLVKGDKGLAIGKVIADGNKNIFPLKIKEPGIMEAISYLKKKGLFPDKDDSDDDYVFGDDDFPS